MLDFLHKNNLPNVHPHILQLFPPRASTASARHNRQLWCIMGFHSGPIYQSEMLSRSIFELIYVYNALSQSKVAATSTKDFQHTLTKISRNLCNIGHPAWTNFLSAREWRHHNEDEWISWFELDMTTWIAFRISFGDDTSVIIYHLLETFLVCWVLWTSRDARRKKKQNILSRRLVLFDRLAA